MMAVGQNESPTLVRRGGQEWGTRKLKPISKTGAPGKWRRRGRTDGHYALQARIHELNPRGHRPRRIYRLRDIPWVDSPQFPS